MIASGGEDGVARVVRKDGVTLAVMNARKLADADQYAAIRSVVLGPRGARLATGEQFGFVRIWDTKSGRLVENVGRERKWIGDLSFDPTGSKLAIGDGEGNVLLYDCKSGQKELLGRHLDGVLSVAFSPDGRTLISASQDRDILVWDLSAHSKRARISDLGGWIRLVRFTADGSRIIGIDGGGEVGIWRPSGELVTRIRRRGAAAEISDPDIRATRWWREASRHDWSRLNCACGRGAQHVPADFAKLVRATTVADASGAGLKEDVEVESMIFESMVPLTAMILATLRDEPLSPPARFQLFDLLLAAVSGESHHVEDSMGRSNLEERCQEVVRPHSDFLVELLKVQVDPGVKERIRETLSCL